jgi:hypothetical protein
MFITYPQPNGQVAVVIPTGDVNDAIKDVPAGVEYKIVESVDIDNDYFNAYEFDAELGAKVNIEKAKAIHLDKFRAARAPKLAKLDIDFMKAVEANDEEKKAEIIAAKQAFRDVTLTPLPDDLAGIKATWPEILNEVQAPQPTTEENQEQITEPSVESTSTEETPSDTLN